MRPASRPSPQAGDRGSADAERLCRRRAMDLLARREHGRLELERKLARDFDGPLLDRVLDDLARDGLQSETRFIDSFIRTRARKGQGPLRIRAELAQRGVEDGGIAAGLAAADCDWCALAVEVRIKRFGAAAPGDFRERARQAKFLQYRGFDGEQVRAALDIAGESD